MVYIFCPKTQYSIYENMPRANLNVIKPKDPDNLLKKYCCEVRTETYLEKIISGSGM